MVDAEVKRELAAAKLADKAATKKGLNKFKGDSCTAEVGEVTEVPFLAPAVLDDEGALLGMEKVNDASRNLRFSLCKRLITSRKLSFSVLAA